MPPPTWNITETQIRALWTEIWPKIVALSWKDSAYRSAFESNTTFRTTEAKRIGRIIGVDYTSDIPIHVETPSELNIPAKAFMRVLETNEAQTARRTFNPDRPNTKGTTCKGGLYGDTYFLINRDGFVMPFPAAPSMSEVYVGYFEGGGVVPRKDPKRPPDEQQRIKDISNGWTPPTGGSNPNCTPAGLSGVALFTLFDKWPKIVALTWDDDSPSNKERRENIKKNPEKYIMPEVWSAWPDIAKPSVDENATEIVLAVPSPLPTEKIDLKMPLPEAPANETNIFDELISGYASNPMYSNCY